MEHTSRRQVLSAGAAVAGVATVAGCGASSSGGGSDDDASRSRSADSEQSTSQSPAAGTTLATLTSIPVGGAVSAKGAKDEPLIVARPSADTAVAFSAICTHMGCTVAPAGKELHCPCHGSVYQAATGKNVSGPAPRPLPKVPVHVAGGKVVTGS